MTARTTSRLVRRSPSLLLLAYFAWTITAWANIRYQWETSLDDREPIRQLERAVGFRGGQSEEPLSADAMGALLEALDHPRSAVKITALWITLQAAKQSELSEELLGSYLRPIAERFLEKQPGVFDQRDKTFLVNFSKRILWHLQLRKLLDETSRVEFLVEALNSDGDDSRYYVSESVDRLVSIRTREAKTFLQEFLEQPNRKEDARARAEIGLMKIEVVEKLADLAEPKKKVDLLAGVFFKLPAAEQEYDQSDDRHLDLRRGFAVWILERVSEIGGTAAEEFLIEVASDDGFDEWPRLVAQRILFERGRIDHPYKFITPAIY